jgi:hypothetical protein
MKNIHVLPAEKPSRLFEILQFCFVFDNQNKYSEEHKKLHKYKNKNIYITDDSEIEAGDYWIYICPINGLDYGDNNNPIVKNNLPTTWFEKLHDKENYKKIILTTDQDLIKDGVQEISEDFLHWFVKNPSCESVEIADLWKDGNPSTHDMYQIIIPQEEPKQENCCTPVGQIKRYKDCIGCDRKPKEFGKPFVNTMPMFEKEYTVEELLKLFRKAPLVFVPAERMYSKEEIKVIARDAYFMGRSNTLIGVFNKWLEKFNKSKQ